MATALETEQVWAQQHPVPESTVQDMLLSLWNYPVAKSDLAPEHRAALDEFLGAALLGGRARPSKTEVYLTGHASGTGDDDANMTLSEQRAKNVARYLLSRGVPQQQMRIDWVGASDPVDNGTSGLAAARNRRVDVLKFTPSEPEARPPVDIIEQPQQPQPAERVPAFKQPAPRISGVIIEDRITVDLPERATPWYVISGEIEVTLKLTATDDGVGVAAGITTSPDGKFGIKADGEIAEHVKSKFYVDVDSDKGTANAKLGAELTDKPFKPEFGIQAKPDFFYITVTLGEVPIAEFEAGGLHFSGTMEFKGTVNFGPGPAALLVASPIIVAILILGLTVYGIEAAETEQGRYTRLLAGREGIAGRIAWELAGMDAAPAFEARRSDWHKANATMEAEFAAGANEVNRILGKSPEARNAWGTEWKKKYAADNTADFQTLFTRIFDNVGGHEAEGTLRDAVARAVAE
jgi:OmpA family